MKATLYRHRASCVIVVALLIVLSGIAFEVGLTRFLAGTATTLRFLRDQAVTIVFLTVVGSLITWLLKLHFSSDQKYTNFDLQKLICYPDGSPDPKKISLWLATFAGMYAFYYLLMHDRATFTSFGIWFLGILFAYAGAMEVLVKKEPTVPGEVVVTDTNIHKRVIEKTPEADDIGKADDPDANK